MPVENKQDKNNDPQRPARIVRLARGIADSCSALKKKFSEKAQELGYSKDLMDIIEKDVGHAPDAPLLSGVEEILSAQFSFMQDQEKEVYQVLNTDFAGMTYSTTTASSIAVISSFMVTPVKPPVFWTPDRRNAYVSKFTKFDTELGKTFSSVWELFYGTTESPEKSALFAMRQAYDHFFRIFAPDEEVRKSQFFTLKEGEKDINKVHRLERIKYVANAKIKDRKVAELLVAKAKHILKVHDELNKMHAEKKLDRNAVQELLTSMQCILEEWVDAVTN